MTPEQLAAIRARAEAATPGPWYAERSGIVYSTCQSMTLTVGSLFSGIGGLDLGLERAGMQIRWQVEIDGYCRRVLARHWPDVPRYSDIRELSGHELEPVDVIAAGFPCQPVSLAGRRRGQEDARWLWTEVDRIVRVVRPRFVLLENVPGLLVRGLGDVLGGLAASGYDAEWDCLPAAAFGAPHLRDRVFIVAYCPESLGDPTGVGCDAGPLVFAEEIDPHEAALRADWWETEPGVGRVAHGVPGQVDRLRALGNAVVPAVAEWIGRRIVAVAGRAREEVTE